MINKTLLDDINSQLDPQEAIPNQFPLNGQFHHFKRGKPEPSSSHVWTLGYSWEYKGNTYQWCKVGDWRSGTNFVVKSWDHSEETKQATNHAKKYIEEAEKTAQQAKEIRHKECKEKWEPIFMGCLVKSQVHPYLTSKRIKDNLRARVRNNTTLLVPIEHPGLGFVGCQQIFKDQETGKFLKLFTKGLRITGSYTRLTNFDIEKTSMIYLCEGYATACSVYEATNIPTVVCFNCNNIIPAIASIRKQNKSIKIIIAGDDDHEVIKPKNPGRYKANLAAKQFSNTLARFPRFETPAGLSDFNDLHVTESLDAVKEQLLFSNSDFINITPLGHKSGIYYYVNTQTSEIFSLSASKHNDSEFMAQAPRSYWGQKYGYKKDKEGSPTKTPDWDQVKESLFEEQRSVGFFENEKVRGIGGWLDQDNIIFNSGKYLYINGVKEPISEHSLQTEYIYEAKKNVDLDLNNSITKDEVELLLSVFEEINLKSPGDYIYIVATLILAQCPGFWSWRSHHWWTGCRGSGKTTMLSWADQLIFTNGIGIIEDPTAAGIRGELQNDAVSVILDEAEPNTIEARKRLAPIMALARQSSSNSGSKIVRGTATGDSISFLINSLFIMGSIQPSLNNQADVSRFTVIELLKGDPVKFAKMQETAQMFPKLKKKLLAFTIKNAHQIIKNQPIIKTELIAFNSKIDARQADQMSWQFAAFWALKYGGDIDKFKLDLLFVTANISDSDYIESNQDNDESECLAAILQASTQDRNSISYCIRHERHEELKSFGIRIKEKINDNEFLIFFSSKNYNLRHALSNTEYQDYAKMMRRLPSVCKSYATTRISGIVTKGFTIKLNLLDGDESSLTSSVNNNTEQNDFNIPF